MSRYKIEWIESDKYGNKKVSATREDGSKLLSAELGKEYKDMQVMAGHDINAKEWTSPKNGKVYLFMEKEQAPGETPRYGASGASKTASITKAMDRKEESIGKTLDRKEESIKLAGAQRDAVLIVVAILNKMPNDDTPKDKYIQEDIISWRNWFLNDKEFNNPPPFN